MDEKNTVTVKVAVDTTELDEAIRKCEELRSVWGLTTIPTCQLIEELKTREGVKTTIAEPYQDVEIQVKGPAIVLVVND